MTFLQPTARRRAARHPRPRKVRQEGAVLLIVLVIFMMATLTATFAVQNAAYEVKAAGALRHAS